MPPPKTRNTANYIFNKYFYEMLDCICKNTSPDSDFGERIKSAHKVKNNNTMKNTDFIKKKMEETPEVFQAMVSSGELPDDYPLCQNGITAGEVFSKLTDADQKTTISSYTFLMSTLMYVHGMEEDEDSSEMLKLVLNIIEKVQGSKDIAKDLENIYDDKLKSMFSSFKKFFDQLPPPKQAETAAGEDKEDADVPDYIKNTQIGKMGMDLFKQIFDKESLPQDPKDMGDLLNPDRLKTIIGATTSYFQDKHGKGQLDLGSMLNECGSIFKEFNTQKDGSGSGDGGQVNPMSLLSLSK